MTGSLDETLVRNDTGQRSRLQDALGSTAALTDGSASVLASYEYQPFGETRISGNSSSAVAYTGRDNVDTGLYYYRARYYSPEQQRFISEDPVGPAGGVNQFVYAANRPTDYRDPIRLEPQPDCYLPDPACVPDIPPPGCEGQCEIDWALRWQSVHPDALKVGMIPMPRLSLLLKSLQITLAKWGIYPTKSGAGGLPQFYNPTNGQYLPELSLFGSQPAQFIKGLGDGFIGGKTGVPIPPPLTPAAGWVKRLEES